MSATGTTVGVLAQTPDLAVENFIQVWVVRTGAPLLMLAFVVWRFLKVDTTRATIEVSLRSELTRQRSELDEIRLAMRRCEAERGMFLAALQRAGIDTTGLFDDPPHDDHDPDGG